MTDHPITPPPELVNQWLGTYFGTTVTGEVSEVELALATQAARWGADQELEACVEWLYNRFRQDPFFPKALRAARRPKLPSLKEQALESLRFFGGNSRDVDTIRRALEQLDD